MVIQILRSVKDAQIVEGTQSNEDLTNILMFDNVTFGYDGSTELVSD